MALPGYGCEPVVVIAEEAQPSAETEPALPVFHE